MSLFLNGQAFSLPGDARVSLLDFIRDHAGLTGTHAGCEQGACGACTVLLDGEAVRSCLVLAVALPDRQVTTIEGVGSPGRLHPVQEALLRHHGLQCGYCTPGMVMAGIELLSRNPDPTDVEVREAMSGNLCRCTGYAGIVAALTSVAGTAPVGISPVGTTGVS